MVFRYASRFVQFQISEWKPGFSGAMFGDIWQASVVREDENCSQLCSQLRRSFQQMCNACIDMINGQTTAATFRKNGLVLRIKFAEVVKFGCQLNS